MTVVGFDFGTTNSLISVVVGDRVIRFDEEGQPIPSVVSYEGGQTIVGREARRRLGVAGLGVHGSIVRSPKTMLGSESVDVDGVARNPVDMVRDVVSYLRSEAANSGVVRNLDLSKAVVTIPVNMEGRRRALLRDAFRMAGVSIVQFVHEPLAALYGHFRALHTLENELRRYDRQLMLVFDWGGGTLDLTLCKLVDGVFVQLENYGTDDVGGDHFDQSIRNEVERRVRESRGLGAEVERLPGADLRLLHECENAKIALSDPAVSYWTIYVEHFFNGIDDTALDLRLTRDDLNSIVGSLIKKGISRITAVLDKQEVSPAAISLCLATGGMANMPLIRSRLHEIFGPARVVLSERSASLISEGAAWVAHDEARLRLSKNVELSLARNSYMGLLEADVEMPVAGERRSDEFSLYCVDPSDGHARFQIVMPQRVGKDVHRDDPRTVLSTMQIKVDSKAQPFIERLNLKVEVDENLILTGVVESLNKGDTARCEVHHLEFALEVPKKKAPRGA
jgi:molecular chaperone DnaK (HSP70)